MEEKDYGINWLGLFIKVIIFVVVALLAIWLLSKLFVKNKGLTLEENTKLFNDATVEYFKNNLPDKRKKNKVTLKQLISWDYLEELKNEKGKKCNKNDSKSTIEIKDNYYNIETTLICGKEKDISNIKLGNENCVECDVKIKGLNEIVTETKKPEQNNPSNDIVVESSKGPVSNNQTSTENNTSNSEQNNEPKPIILYEYVKETDEYSDWYNGKVTGSNIENSTKKVSYSKYCKEDTCITDTTDSKDNYKDYKIKDTWNENIDIYRYKITIKEYKYSNSESLEGYTKTGNTKVAE